MRAFGGILAGQTGREFCLTAAARRLTSQRVRGPALDAVPLEIAPAPASRPAYSPGFVEPYPFSVRSSTPFSPLSVGPSWPPRGRRWGPKKSNESTWPEAPPSPVATTDSESNAQDEDEKACYSFSKNYGPCK